MGIFDFLKRNKRNLEKPPTKDDKAEPTEFKFVVPIPPDNTINKHLIPKDVYVPKSKGELSEVTQSIWTYAPDDYDQVYCSTPPCPTMETDFEELRKGIELVFRQKRFNESRPKLMGLVEKSYIAYKSGDRKKGMELISQIQIMQGKMK